MGSLQHCRTDVSMSTMRHDSILTITRVSTGNGQPSITLYDSTLDFKVDDEEHMRIIPPTIFVRLRQEIAASRINKLLYSANSHRFAEGAATSYMSLEADRLKEERVREERGTLDGVDNGEAAKAYTQMLHLLIECRPRRTLSLCRLIASSSLLILQPRSSSRTPR